MILVLVLPLFAQDTKRMDEIVRYYADQQKFMGSVLVARAEVIIFQKSYGYANLEWRMPSADDGKFEIGSVTKQFTAACILLLQEQGKLNVDDPVKKYYAEAPPAWDKITLRNLLTHTSGLPNFTSFPDYLPTETLPTTPEKLIERFRDKSLEFQPGTKWAYSNSNYIVLGYVIEKTSGTSYAEFLQKNVLEKLEMANSGIDDPKAILPHRVSGYMPTLKGPENANYVNMTVPYAAGAMYSTTGDLLKWNLGLYGGKLLKPESLVQMTTPFKDNYGFGLFVSTENGHKVISHGGGIEGFNAEVNYYPDDKLTVVTLANINGPEAGEIAKDLAAVAHNVTVTLPNERKAMTLAPSVLQAYVGDYTLGPATMTISLQGDQLYAQLTAQPKYPIYAEAETKFFWKIVDAEVEFEKDASGKVTKAVLYQGGQKLEWTRK